jgi:hypothetical protein
MRLLSMLCLLAALSAPTGAGAQTLTLEDMIREVKVALLRVEQIAREEEIPPLHSVDLELNTVQVVDGNGKVSFLIFVIDGGVKTEQTNTVKLTLVPPPPESGSSVAAANIADTLTQAILAGARAIKLAGQGQPPLVANELKATLKFAFTKKAGGGLQLQFPPFEIGGSGSGSHGAVQTLSVTYKLSK